MEETENRTKTDKPWLFQPGQSGNPGGRPKNTLKGYIQRKLDKMTDEEKELWLLEHKVSGIDQWKMGEGNPKQDIEADVKAVINVIVPGPVAEAFNINGTHTEASGSNTEQV